MIMAIMETLMHLHVGEQPLNRSSLTRRSHRRLWAKLQPIRRLPGCWRRLIFQNICINYKAQTCSFRTNIQNDFMQIYLIQRASSPNIVRIFERCKHVFGGLSNECEIEGEAECDSESRSQGDDPASYPKWAPQMQFRKPQISIPKSTNHFVISAQESRSQGEELVALPSRIHQDPSPAQTGTDQLRTEY